MTAHNFPRSPATQPPSGVVGDTAKDGRDPAGQATHASHGADKSSPPSGEYPSRKRYPRADRMVASTGEESLFKASMAFKRLREQLSARQGWRCYWCGGLCDRPKGPAHKGDAMVATLEHLVPLRDGGATDANNCVMACRACNQSRDKEPHLYTTKMLEATK